jgi:DNA-3-methyladenine glycosylase II
MLTRVPLSYTGEFSLASSIAFLEGWPPSAPQAQGTRHLHWAFHSEPGWELVDVAVTQHETGVTAAIETEGSTEAATDRVVRILGLDVDASGFTPETVGDPVAASLIAARPGLRPASFWSPYEAAVWAVLSQRVSMVQASKLKLRIAQALGRASGDFSAFPPPQTLLDMDRFDGLSQIKIERLHAVAEAALTGALEAASLREKETDEALAGLRSIPGIGPFSAELILVRGAGHPDVFPSAEQRLHRIMRDRYDLPNATPAELADIAEAWAPYRSWVSFLFRSAAM